MNPHSQTSPRVTKDVVMKNVVRKSSFVMKNRVPLRVIGGSPMDLTGQDTGLATIRELEAAAGDGQRTPSSLPNVSCVTPGFGVSTFYKPSLPRCSGGVGTTHVGSPLNHPHNQTHTTNADRPRLTFCPTAWLRGSPLPQTGSSLPVSSDDQASAQTVPDAPEKANSWIFMLVPSCCR